MRTEKFLVFEAKTFRDAIVECPVDSNGNVPQNKINDCKIEYSGRPKTLRNGITFKFPHRDSGLVGFDLIELKDGTKLIWR